MLIAQYGKSAVNLGRSLPIVKLDAAAIAHARAIFTDYRKRGIVLDSLFENPEWKLSDETTNVTLVLLSFADGGGSDIQDWIGIGRQQYTDCLKAYTVLKFGDFRLDTIRGITKTLAALPYCTPEGAAGIAHNAAHIAEFLSLLPEDSPDRDWVEESLDERVRTYRIGSGIRCRRVLAAFESYLRFNEVLSEFWQAAADGAKLFYFPVYFWWNLTAILPLRPTEFLLTPRNCIDGNILAVRRTKLKGLGGKVNYRIAQDYQLCRYEITPALASEIKRYIEMTDDMPETELGTLFRLDAHYSRMRMSADERSRYYTYNHMRTCLSMFLAETAGGDVDIGSINLGDTRHLAMISLIISGGSPTICKELAGHSDVGVSSHYYSNISTIVERTAIDRFRKFSGGNAEFAGEARYPLKRPGNMERLADGWCDSEMLKAGEVGDCMKVVDRHGRIGECSSCGHYWPDTPGMRLQFFDTNYGRQRVDLDSAFLMRMTELVRKGIGCEEEIAAALLRLQKSCNHYGDCLAMKYLNAEME
jgi:hypothetical protein